MAKNRPLCAVFRRDKTVARSIRLSKPRVDVRRFSKKYGMGNQRARSRGLRHGTRNMFSRPFRKKGTLNATTFLRTFR
tara:strand:+ start:2760 stop:2993 length:234 start_codon:yes stop_codon:yes gene_type:complete